MTGVTQETVADPAGAIEVAGLRHTYKGGHTALDGVELSFGTGLFGLLGPNGAGKSTTLRILAGFMPGDSGSVRVNGFDVGSESLAVRNSIGYLPEGVPLYPDMRVREYLKFRARLKGLNREESRDRVGDVMEQLSLTDVQHRMIGALSKGYRQRVGLADALVHEPELLILDEPTIGLDPHQIRTVRQHIKELGRDHTVLISSHILPEVEVTCTQLLIFHEGNILAADTPRGLEQRLGGRQRITVELNAPMVALDKAWEEMAEIEHHRILPAEGNFYRSALTPRDGEDLRPRISALAHARGWPLRELTRERHTLEIGRASCRERV